MNDYRRPADYQVQNMYECSNCGAETTVESCYVPEACNCGGSFNKIGESYPADSRDWHEERDSVNDDFRNPHQRY